jgi:hypothetical protein
MIHIRNISDTDLLNNNPELYREVTSYLLYCRHELLEYDAEDDVGDHDFNIMDFGEKDFPMLNDLGPPHKQTKFSSCLLISDKSKYSHF